jgi:hypothetical protein
MVVAPAAPPALLLNLVASCDASIHRVDRSIRGYLTRPRRLGLYDEMVVALTADHSRQFFGDARRLEKLGDLQEREPSRDVLLLEANIVATRSARSNPEPGVPR